MSGFFFFFPFFLIVCGNANFMNWVSLIAGIQDGVPFEIDM